MNSQSIQRCKQIAVAGLLLLVLVSTKAQDEEEPAAPVPAGVTAISTQQSSRVLVPKQKGAQRLPVLVMLPFTGGDAQDLFDRYTDELMAVQRDIGPMLIVIPEDVGSRSDYDTAAAWNDTLDYYGRLVASDVDELVRGHGADPARVVLAGYSMGGDLTWALMQRTPERYSGGIIMGSRASYRAKGALEKLAARGARLVFFMGESEEALRLAGAEAAQVALSKAGLPFRSLSGPGAHVPAAPAQFIESLRYVLEPRGLAAPTLPPPAAVVVQAPPPSMPTAAIIPSRPGCGWQPFANADESRWGYRDAQGKVVVPPTLLMAESFSDKGIASVLTPSREWGYIGCDGKIFTVVTEDIAPDRFREGLARKKQGALYGFVNLRGEFVIAPRFEYAQGFCKGIAEVGSFCRVEKREEHQVVSCRRSRYIDQRGNEVPTPAEPYDLSHCGIAESTEIVEKLSSCKLDRFTANSDDGELIGFKDAQGKVLVKPRFTSVGEFGADGLAPVQENFSASYLNCEGKTFDVLYNDGPDAFSDGLVRYEGESYDIGYRNRLGKVVIPARYAYASPFCGGIAKVGKSCTVERDDGRFTAVECQEWSFINQSGKVVSDPASEWSCGGEAFE